MNTWVLLRGLTRESRHWGEFPAALRAEIGDVVVAAPDLPGNGRHHRVKSPASIEALAECCRAELRTQGLAPPYYLLAMSLGAMAAVSWAQRHPEELRGCVLINTSLRPFSSFHERLRPRNYAALLRLALSADADPERTILRMTSRGGADRTGLLEAWNTFRREHPVSPANALRQLFAAARYRAPAQKPALPFLVLASRGDDFVDPSCSQRLASAWRTDFALHPSAGHDLPLDDPAWVAREVRRWLPGL